MTRTQFELLNAWLRWCEYQNPNETTHDLLVKSNTSLADVNQISYFTGMGIECVIKLVNQFVDNGWAGKTAAGVTYFLKRDFIRQLPDKRYEDIKFKDVKDIE